jgi:hypothetical protein
VPWSQVIDRREGERRLLEPRPAPVATLMRAAGAQRRTMLRSQPRRAQERRSGLIDGLVRQPHPGFVGEPAAQMAADLLRTPPLREQSTEQLAQLPVALDTTSMLAGSRSGRASMSLEWAIAATGDRVAAQLPADRRGRPSQPRRAGVGIGCCRQCAFRSAARRCRSLRGDTTCGDATTTMPSPRGASASRSAARAFSIRRRRVSAFFALSIASTCSRL